MFPVVLCSGEPTFTLQRHLVKSAFLTVLLAFSLSRLSRELNNTRAIASPRRRPIHRQQHIAVRLFLLATRVLTRPFTVIDCRADYIKRNAFTWLRVYNRCCKWR